MWRETLHKGEASFEEEMRNKPEFFEEASARELDLATQTLIVITMVGYAYPALPARHEMICSARCCLEQLTTVDICLL